MNTSSSATPTASVYPIPRPRSGEDVRFTLGLALDVAAVLARHGYPPLSCGTDLIHWQQALFAAIYRKENRESPLHSHGRA
jgi:hypothetical protein